VILVGTATLVTGAVLAYGQTDLKRLLAFTTVSALGTLTVLVGISTELSAMAAMVFLLVHALYKAALFLGVGAIDHEAGTRDVRQLGGLARAMPLTAFAVVASALSMAGLPPFFGFVAKELFYEAKQEAPRAGDLLVIASFAGSALVAAAAGLVAWRPFFGTARRRRSRPRGAARAVAGTGAPRRPERGPRPAARPPRGAPRAARGERDARASTRRSCSAPGWDEPRLRAEPPDARARRRALRGARPGARPAAAAAAARRLGTRAGLPGGMAGIVALAKAQTRLLQSGVLGWYLLVTIGTTVPSAATPS
jgi:multicomponent Na+:H+ antiporter subunit A